MTPGRRNADAQMLLNKSNYEQFLSISIATPHQHLFLIGKNVLPVVAHTFTCHGTLGKCLSNACMYVNIEHVQCPNTYHFLHFVLCIVRFVIYS